MSAAVFSAEPTVARILSRTRWPTRPARPVRGLRRDRRARRRGPAVRGAARAASDMLSLVASDARSARSMRCWCSRPACVVPAIGARAGRYGSPSLTWRSAAATARCSRAQHAGVLVYASCARAGEVLPERPSSTARAQDGHRDHHVRGLQLACCGRQRRVDRSSPAGWGTVVAACSRR